MSFNLPITRERVWVPLSLSRVLARTLRVTSEWYHTHITSLKRVWGHVRTAPELEVWARATAVEHGADASITDGEGRTALQRLSGGTRNPFASAEPLRTKQSTANSNFSSRLNLHTDGLGPPLKLVL